MCGLERIRYSWFERRRKTKTLDLAQEQITKALDTVTCLHQTMQYISEAKKKEAILRIQNLMSVEAEVDRLRREVFRELSKGTALIAEYREDVMHVVKRLDTLADHVKDAARCVKILADSEVPLDFWRKVVNLTSKLLDCASALRSSIENIMTDPTRSLNEAKRVQDIESELDQEYLTVKSLLIEKSEKMNCGVMILFDDMIEYIEQAADMCANTADYILILASRDTIT